MKVCVIDDDDIYQFLLKKELKHTNLVDRINVFTDGQKAIDFFFDNKERQRHGAAATRSGSNTERQRHRAAAMRRPQ